MKLSLRLSKSANSIGWALAAIILLLASPHAQTNAHDTGQAVDYREMSRILSRFEPGIDYVNLHFQHILKNPYRPMRNRYRYSYGTAQHGYLRAGCCDYLLRY